MSLKQFVKDGWSNILTGLGISGRDKRLSGQPNHVRLTEVEVEELYAGDDMAAKIVDRIPLDGTRAWIDLIGYEEETQKELIKNHQRLFLQSKIRKAWQDARLYGGSAILIINQDTDLSKPLDFQNPGIIKNLINLNRWEISRSGASLISDLSSPRFGLPEYYRFNKRQNIETNIENIHHSRMIFFSGARLPYRKFVENNYWHDSVLSKIFNILSNFNQTHDSVSYVMLDFRDIVLKIKGLSEKVVTKGSEDALTARLEIMRTMRSIMSAIVIDADNEEYDNKQTRLNGIKEPIQAVNSRLVAAAEMPHTLLLGESPSGLGATGESEWKDYFATVGAYQEDKCREPIQNINDLIINQKVFKNKPKEGIEGGFKFNSIEILTEKEYAELEKITAEKDQIYFNIGVLTSEEIADSRYGSGKFSTDTQIDMENRESLPEISPDDANEMV